MNPKNILEKVVRYIFRSIHLQSNISLPSYFPMEILYKYFICLQFFNFTNDNFFFFLIFQDGMHGRSYGRDHQEPLPLQVLQQKTHQINVMVMQHCQAPMIKVGAGIQSITTYSTMEIRKEIILNLIMLQNIKYVIIPFLQNKGFCPL